MKLGSLSLFRLDAPQGTAAGMGEDPAPCRHAQRVHLLGQLAGIVTLFSLWPLLASPWQLLPWWLGVSGAQMLLTGLTCPGRLARHGSALHDPVLGYYLFSIIALIGGGAWGALALIGPYDAGPVAQTILYLVLGGATLAGAGLLSASRSASAVFVAAAQLPLFIQTVVTPPEALPNAGLFLGIFMLFALTLNDVLATSREKPLPRDSALEEADMLRQAMLDHAGEAILLSRGHRIQRWNRRFSEITRFSPVEIAGQRLDTCFSNRQEWRRHARAAMDCLGRGEIYRGVTRLRRRGGSHFWAEVSGRRIGTSPTPVCVVWSAADISERIQASTLGNLVQGQLLALIGQCADWYWQTDCHHRLMQIVPQEGRPDGALQERIGRRWWQLHRDEHGEHFSSRGALHDAFKARRVFRDLQVNVPDGSHTPRSLKLSGTPRFDEHGSFLGYHGIATDVTARVREQERLHHLAYHDPLTGLPNRRLLLERLERAIARARNGHCVVGLVLADVDDFKRINDLAGRDVGDRILMEIGDRLGQGLAASHTVARLEGDTFAILLPESAGEDDAESVAAQAHALLQQPLAQPSPRNPLGASLGVACFPRDAAGAGSLLAAADRRLLRAKRRGGHCIEQA